MSFKVQRGQCNQCLFSKNKIVSDERKAEILAATQSEDSFFICHKQQTTKTDAGDFGLGLCCKGFFDRYPTRPIRMAKALGVVEFVEVK